MDTCSNTVYMHGVATKLFNEVRNLEKLLTLNTHLAYNHELVHYTMGATGHADICSHSQEPRVVSVDTMIYAPSSPSFEVGVKAVRTRNCQIELMMKSSA